VELGELARDTRAARTESPDHFIQCGREALGRLEEDDRPGFVHPLGVERFAFADFRGTKPSIAKRSVDRPLIVSAATTADGPGAVVTRRPASATAAATRAPGSLMPGVPASLMTTTVCPLATCATT